MKKKETKINFYALLKYHWKTPEHEKGIEEPFYGVIENLNYIMKLSKKNRFYELKDNKFCFLDSLRINENYCEGYFKSARNEFRPNLINKTTGNERKNPKEKSEGDIEKTHFVFKIDNENNEVYLFLENNHTGISINTFINYLNKFTREFELSNKRSKSFTIRHTIIVRNDFLQELKKLSVAKIAEVVVDKQILGNNVLKFSNRIVPIQSDILITIKAQKGENLTNFAVDTYNKFVTNEDDGIRKIRIYGQDENGNKTLVDTSFMGQVDFVSTTLDDNTGEAVSQILLNSIKEIAVNF